MKLGDLIDTLAAIDPSLPIRFDGGTQVGRLASWRGVYAELTLTHGADNKQRTVGDVLEDARNADGGTFQGYKGGDYTMDRFTPVWADDYGDCNYNAVQGISITDGVVIIHRFNVGDYR